jgi:hypothetical protein
MPAGPRSTGRARPSRRRNRGDRRPCRYPCPPWSRPTNRSRRSTSRRATCVAGPPTIPTSGSGRGCGRPQKDARSWSAPPARRGVRTGPSSSTGASPAVRPGSRRCSVRSSAGRADMSAANRSSPRGSHRALSSEVEHSPYKRAVGGSSPPAPTPRTAGQGANSPAFRITLLGGGQAGHDGCCPRRWKGRGWSHHLPATERPRGYSCLPRAGEGLG